MNWGHLRITKQIIKTKGEKENRLYRFIRPAQVENLDKFKIDLNKNGDHCDINYADNIWLSASLGMVY